MKSNFGAKSLKTATWSLFIAITCILFYSCKSEDEKPKEKDIVRKEELFPDRVKTNLSTLVNYASENAGKINDSTSLKYVPLIRNVYLKNNFTAIWSADGKWVAIGDSLNNFIRTSMHYGLFPNDYHLKALPLLSALLSSIRVSARRLAYHHKQPAREFSEGIF